jgi:HEAT repeat protein
MSAKWSFRFWWTAILLLIVLGVVYFLRFATVNPMHVALDELATVNLANRWSHPRLLEIRAQGAAAMPLLRRALREKNSASTRLLLWIKAKCPWVIKYYSRFPDANKLSERYWTACQVLQSLGPAAKSATPELIEMLKSNDVRDLNGTAMALFAIGIDANVCEHLDELMEKGQVTSPSARLQIVHALGQVKPPSKRTLKVLSTALTDSSSWVQHGAAQTLGSLGVRTPEIVSALKRLQSTTTDDLTVITSSAALWELEHNASLVREPVFRVLESLLNKPVPTIPGGGSGGQGVTGADQAFTAAAGLFPKMNLTEADKTKALDLLESWSDKTDRIFIRMLLLSSMMELGLSHEKCVAICQEGLNRGENYYRIQAARLFAIVNEKHPVEGRYLEVLLGSPDVAVRVYAAKIHWHENQNAAAIVPILTEALNQTKYQSYNYPEVQSVALKALGDVGSEAHEAITILEKIARDPNPNVAKQASEALAKIRK